MVKYSTGITCIQCTCTADNVQVGTSSLGLSWTYAGQIASFLLMMYHWCSIDPVISGSAVLPYLLLIPLTMYSPVHCH